MISDWRGDRRIGSPGAGERTVPYLRAAAVSMAISAVLSALLVFLHMKLDGEPYSVLLAIGMWCLVYLAACLLSTAQTGLSGRWLAALVVFALTSPLAAIVWFSAQPLLSHFGIAPDAILNPSVAP